MDLKVDLIDPSSIFKSSILRCHRARRGLRDEAATAALEAAMAGMETARATFEAKASRVADELERLQEHVNATNTKVSGERVQIADAERR